MAQARIGRPPNPLDPTASWAARLGYVLRTAREDKGLTLEKLAALVGFTPQRISDIERAKATASHPFLAACEEALDAAGKLLPLLPAVQRERDTARQARADARRKARRSQAQPALRCEADGDAGEDLEPTNRRGLIGAGTAAAIGLSTTTASATAREVDPGLPDHLDDLLRLLGRHDEMFGPHDVLDIVRREIAVIARQRRAARGELRIAIMRVESRYAEFAAWLGHDTGRAQYRDACTRDALALAREAGYPDMIAYARSRQSQWAAQDGNARRAVALAEDALKTPGASPQIRAWCALRAALGQALAGDIASCERSLAHAFRLVEYDSPTPPWAGGFRLTATAVRGGEAQCWLSMRPSKAIPLYELALSDWPREESRGAGVLRSRLALACASAGQLDRARAEGRKAFAIAGTTKSAVAHGELQRLTAVLRAA